MRDFGRVVGAWDAGEEELLKKGFTHGYGVDQIANTLRRSEKSVIWRMHKLGLIVAEQRDVFLTEGFLPQAHFIAVVGVGENPITRSDPFDSETEVMDWLRTVASGLMGMYRDQGVRYGIETHYQTSHGWAQGWREVEYHLIAPLVKKGINLYLTMTDPAPEWMLPKTPTEMARRLSMGLGFQVEVSQ